MAFDRLSRTGSIAASSGGVKAASEPSVRRVSLAWGVVGRPSKLEAAGSKAKAPSMKSENAWALPSNETAVPKPTTRKCRAAVAARAPSAQANSLSSGCVVNSRPQCNSRPMQAAISAAKQANLAFVPGWAKKANPETVPTTAHRTSSIRSPRPARTASAAASTTNSATKTQPRASAWECMTVEFVMTVRGSNTSQAANNENPHQRRSSSFDMSRRRRGTVPAFVVDPFRYSFFRILS
ncbi:hypothetical protein [Gordonibacter massiliensis (ex Traore et al. 2017)]|uniref:hypothetical protein n=1 Tax=Gordonibacter massiliensis (ex Traore et al. 2017) TaxID=1841863 RepID=UPI001C8BC299|nr:hypothetical protein [Gordonibacter massiliensis (ex Traore et al. 2017)]MBX9033895.1 hypothetical protein [Gordonibacter massiliensis (ex Traore et al. 2017)]